MRFLRPLFVSLAVAVAVVGFAQHDVKSARRAIEAQEARFVKAFRAHDLKTITNLMSPDCVNEMANGRKVSRKKEIQYLKTLFGAVKKISALENKVTSCKLANGGAIVKCDNLLKAQINVQGKTKTFVSRNQTTEEWTLYKGTWVLKHSKEAPGGKTTVDGIVQKEG